MLQVGDKVHFGEIKCGPTDDRISIWRFKGTIIEVETKICPGYVCKPDVGSERFVQADLVSTDYSELTRNLIKHIEISKREQLRMHNDALRELG